MCHFNDKADNTACFGIGFYLPHKTHINFHNIKVVILEHSKGRISASKIIQEQQNPCFS